MSNIDRFEVKLNSDLVTSAQKPTSRIKTDNQQTSFEEARQFKYFDRLVNIPQSSQVVYRITLTNPINLTKRRLSLISGGREYLVYSSDQVSTTGTFVASGRITADNQNPDPSVIFKPSGVTIERAIGAGILTVNANELPSDGLATLADGNNNRASNELDDDSDKIGYAGDQIAYAVLNHIGSNNATTGQLKLKWEEIFD